MNDDVRITVVEQILLAAHDLGADGGPFSAEDLVVKAWERDPEHFGLQGYAGKYPDSNRVLTKIMGKSSVLRQRGWLRKVGTKRYRLTEPGRLAAEEAHKRASGIEIPKRLSSLDRGFIGPLLRMLESNAFEKFLQGESLTFSDVCGFWNISPRSSAHQLAAQMELADTAIRVALEATAADQGRNLAVPGSSTRVTRGELEKLSELSGRIREIFAEDLDVIRSRSDERRL